jgi:hypothetical protein
MYIHAHVQTERGRERKETKATEKKLRINIKKSVHGLYEERSCIYAQVDVV